jgi:hypothetical protein
MARLSRIRVAGLICLLAGMLLAQTPLVSMRGTLRVLDKKQIIIDTGDEQLVTFRRVKKTRFLKGAKEIPESEFHPGASVLIEASRERDGEFDAVNVFLGDAPASIR